VMLTVLLLIIFALSIRSLGQLIDEIADEPDEL